jgi:hypothetical protein
LLLEGLGRSDRKDRDVVHARAPLLRIARSEAERHTAHRLRAVGHIGLAAGQRETADDGDAAGLEDDGLGKANALAVALEVTRDADAFGMVASEAGIDAVDLLKGIDYPRPASGCVATASRRHSQSIPRLTQRPRRSWPA